MTVLTTRQDVDDCLRGADFLSACGGAIRWPSGRFYMRTWIAG